MSLFERIKNKRYELQEERKKFPGDESGAYKRAKADIETKNLIKKAGGSGDIGFNAPKRKEKVLKRTTRAIKQGTPDPFEVDTSKAAKQTAKDFGTPTTKSQIKKLSKKPGGYSAPKGEFGPGITKGQANIKGMERRAFKITKPSDVKLPQTFTDFSKKLRRYKSDVQDFKDKDIATMRTGKSSSKVKVSGANNLTRQDVGMAPPDTPKKSKAQKFTDKINKQNKNRPESGSGYSQANKPKPGSEPTVFKPKGVDAQVVDTTPFDAKSGTKRKVDVTKNLTRKNRGFKEPLKIKKTRKVKSSIFNPPTQKTVSDIMKQNTIKGAKGPTSMKDVQIPKFLNMRTGNINVRKTKGAVDYSKLSSANKSFARTASAIVRKTPKPLQKVASGVAKAGLKLGKYGRLGLAGGLISGALSPAGRRLIGYTLAGGGLAYLANRKGPPKLKVGDGITKTTNLPSKFQPKNAKNLSYVDAYGKKRKLGSGDVRFKFGLTGTKKNKDGTVTPGGMQYNKQDMARVKNIQKKYIDSYNASVKGNPFKKQIKYSVNKDGSYTVTPPKKK